MKVLTIGGGGREMALVEHLVRSEHEVYAAGASDAISQIAQPIPMPSSDAPQCWQELADIAQAKHVDLTIVGPEAPLATGIADVFVERSLPIFAPTQAAARIETSKAYAKEIMGKAGVPTAQYRLVTSKTEAFNYVESSEASYPIVLKENGLRAGKGVTIAASLAQARETIAQLELDADNPLLIEEFLEGFEFSLIVMAHGTRFVALPVAQDHKPIGEGNTGPNTGGMGAVSPVPRVTDEIYHEAIERVIEPTLACMAKDGNPFTGFLYAGLMHTNDGVKVIEFNARLGDPEAEVILPRLHGDIARTALALLGHADSSENVHASHSDGHVPDFPVTARTCLGIVLSSPGYPASVTEYPKIPQELISAIEAHPDAGITHMGTKRLTDGSWQAHGGRVAIVTMMGEDIHDCRTKLLELMAEALKDSSLYYRRDIGTFAGCDA